MQEPPFRQELAVQSLSFVSQNLPENPLLDILMKIVD